MDMGAPDLEHLCLVKLDACKNFIVISLRSFFFLEKS